MKCNGKDISEHVAPTLLGIQNSVGVLASLLKGMQLKIKAELQGAG
ncbi:MAG: hypothetical protein ACTS73_05930 [Arsenophonus sp. NEOnobi-MAG3]